MYLCNQRSWTNEDSPGSQKFLCLSPAKFFVYIYNCVRTSDRVYNGQICDGNLPKVKNNQYSFEDQLLIGFILRMRTASGSSIQPIAPLTVPLYNKRLPSNRCIHKAQSSLSMLSNKKTRHNNYMSQHPRSVQPSAYLLSPTHCYSPCLQPTRVKRPQLSSIRESCWFLILTLSRMRKSSPTFFQIIWLVALISCSLMLTCAIATTGDQSSSPSISNEPFIDLFTQEQTRGHCVDSNGTLHALFTSWLEHSTCKCTCYPTARMAVSVCDGCVVVTPSPTSAGTRWKTSQLKPNEINRNQLVESEAEQQTVTTKRKSCLYTLTGVWYHHSEIWMSAKMPCVKCRCEDGTIRCTGEPHHCPPLCLPGQQSLPPGPCCETVCRGKGKFDHIRLK
ncbi:hypothetical protein P879_08314 [Paragonimus westermani]|uniref:VWFC domain-containing protein n=1 Tax=Paragonimus westermani TaxID=34504 RepID=A0A8T0DII5_9TREM|nr:hypothetical protein P879_08314 [Paragonimus westermani]